MLSSQGQLAPPHLGARNNIAGGSVRVPFIGSDVEQAAVFPRDVGGAQVESNV